MARPGALAPGLSLSGPVVPEPREHRDGLVRDVHEVQVVPIATVNAWPRPVLTTVLE